MIRRPVSMVRPLAAVSLVVLIAGCAAHGLGGTAVTTPTGTGIEGRVVIGPTCPVERVGSPCPDRPHQADLRVRSVVSGDVVASARSDGEGRFRVDLPPGDYTVEPILRGVFPSGAPTEVTVRPGRYTAVTIRLDSGIR